MWNSGVMTTASKSGHLRDVAVSTGGNAIKAARLYSAGPAVVGFRAAQHGVGLARREKQRRKARRTTPPPSSPVEKTSSRKLLLLGALLGAAAAVAVVLSKRRSTIDPPADVPPSLDDYAHITSPVNGSSAHSAQQ
jgi:chemotaxis response regulator CheB